MSQIVLDASVALAWCFSDENSGYAAQVLTHLESADAIVPQLFWIELANATLTAQRRGRMLPDDVKRFTDLLAQLQIETDTAHDMNSIFTVRELAERANLTVYDSMYLELAIRHGLQLATLDEALIRAAKNLKVDTLHDLST